MSTKTVVRVIIVLSLISSVCIVPSCSKKDQPLSNAPNENVSLEGTKKVRTQNSTSTQRSITQSAAYAALTPAQQALVNQLQAEFGIVELTPAQTAGMQVQSFSDYQSAAADLSNAINQLNA
ncbi:hypothetical protein [Flavisolibacter tropicus]|uniref:Uncharacterized protein n=1 Tax=Flavisolibacter tropicus TaxID=1492898 RepID=A0A172TWH2_9BACT|nr:hypothetical protein [Flavisolibacter tropicus]ANE51461.1 hypothetical protein SY85_14055 [Flavisolibacter tropicus]